MDIKNKQVEQRYCPLCKELNYCGADSGGCWCFHTEIPAELLERVPLELRGKACICQRCVEAFKKHQPEI
ncbi:MULTISPECIES: cysteine-rich CWC family protein [unclassified Paenibacillus]|uniref:cysteine-rich CWC family protein n=1 Tax=unclassified Paenibacillus TaxID=185978 RepID=UPI0030D71413